MLGRALPPRAAKKTRIYAGGNNNILRINLRLIN
jgi:hypothetical protein